MPEPEKNEKNSLVRSICWLASYPKSGNTWVRMLLASYLNNGNPVSINSLPRLLTYQDTKDVYYLRLAPVPLNELTFTDTLFLRDAALFHMVTEANSSLVFIKTHSANMEVDGFKLIRPQVTRSAVYMIRDPRDVAVSFANHAGLPIDDVIDMMGADKAIGHNTFGLAQSTFDYLSSWSKHVSTWLSGEHKVAVVRYESLMSDPVRIFKGLVEFLGSEGELDQDKIRRCVENCSFDRLSEEEDERGFVEKSPKAEKFFRRGKVGGWVDVLTPEQSRRIEDDHGEVMERFGYIGGHVAEPILRRVG
jgi:hypothetical protein